MDYYFELMFIISWCEVDTRQVPFDLNDDIFLFVISETFSQFVNLLPAFVQKLFLVERKWISFLFLGGFSSSQYESSLWYPLELHVTDGFTDIWCFSPTFIICCSFLNQQQTKVFYSSNYEHKQKCCKEVTQKFLDKSEIWWLSTGWSTFLRLSHRVCL